MSAGQLFDLIMPAAFAVSAIVSTWVLASARKRFRFYYALALALGTLFLPFIVFPIYLVLMMWRPKIGPPRRWRYSLPLLYGWLFCLRLELTSISIVAALTLTSHAPRGQSSWKIRQPRFASIVRRSNAKTIHTRTSSSQSSLLTRVISLKQSRSFDWRSKEASVETAGRIVDVRLRSRE